MTMVSGPNRAGTLAATDAMVWALIARITRSCGPASSKLFVAFASLARYSVPSAQMSLRPLFLIASRWLPWSISVTSLSERASLAPMRPPMAPAPTTQIFMRISLSPTYGANSGPPGALRRMPAIWDSGGPAGRRAPRLPGRADLPSPAEAGFAKAGLLP